MKSIDLSKSLGILANIGVIASIIFLGFEVRQNHLVGRAEARNELARAEQELMMFDLSNGVEFLLLQMSEEEFGRKEILKINVWTDLWLQFYENTHYQYRMGLFDEDEFQAKLREMKIWINTFDRARETFCRGRPYSSPSFIELMESVLETPCE